MHLHKGDSSYSQPPHSPRVRTRLPPPPAASLDPPHTEGGAGTGAAPGDCPLHRPNALLSPACPGKSHHPHGAVTRGWMALVLPGKRGGPSRTHPFQLCPQPLAHPAQDPCPCCFPAHHAGGCLPLPRTHVHAASLPTMQEGVSPCPGPVSMLLPCPPCRRVSPPAHQRPRERQPGGALGALGWFGYREEPGYGGQSVPWVFTNGASTPQHGHREWCWSLTQTWCPQSLSQPQGHCRLPGADPLRALAQPTCRSRQQALALMGKSSLTDGSGWNFRHSGLAPPWPTSPSPQGARAHGVGVALTVLSPRSPTAK